MRWLLLPGATFCWSTFDLRKFRHVAAVVRMRGMLVCGVQCAGVEERRRAATERPNVSVTVDLSEPLVCI